MLYAQLALSVILPALLPLLCPLVFFLEDF